MKNCFLSILSLLVLQNCVAQSWVPLGSYEQTANSIVKTHEFTFFSKVSASGVPYFTYKDNDTGINNLADFKIHAKRYMNGKWELAGDAIAPTGTINGNFPLVFDNDTPYVAYSELVNATGAKSRLTIKKLNSETSKWEVVGTPVLSDSTIYGAVMAASNRKIYITYPQIAANKISVIYYDNNNAAAGWQTISSNGFVPGIVTFLNIAVDNGTPYVAYINYPEDAIIVKKFNGTNWTDVGTNEPSPDRQALSLSLQFNSTHTPFISYIDVNGTGKVRALNNAGTWVAIGSQPIAENIISSGMSFVMLKDVPFAAYATRDADSNTQVYVKKYSLIGDSWIDAGGQPAVANTSFFVGVQLSTDNDKNLYLIYRNFKDSGIYAKQFNASATLPVTLSTFYGTKQQDEAILNWVVSSEPGIGVFEVEHSTDALIFTKLAAVPANNHDDAPHYYSYIHFNPAIGPNYYRLKLIDRNGHFTYSKIVSMSFSSGQTSFIKIFPNPVKNVLHISNLPAGVKDIIIHSADGRLIKTLKSYATGMDIDVTGISAGTYFISLCGDALNETKTFMK